MSDPLRERVAIFLAAEGLLQPTTLLLVAVSGGPDSLCLLHVLNRLREAGGPQLHVAHLDHGTRGDQSAAEAAVVAAWAAAWGLPITLERRDVPALAQAEGDGLLAAARRARYAFLAATALQSGSNAVVVAHQADDQAETVLLHVLRGSGLAGLRGMRPLVAWAEWANRPLPTSHAPPLIRPLLTTSRAEISAYCCAHGLAPLEDPSNRSPRFARARIRALLPTLAAENPRLNAALARTAHLCADDYDFIQQQLAAIWPALARTHPGIVILQRSLWAGLHPAMQRYALRRAAASLGTTELSLAQVEAARAAAAQTGRRLRLSRNLHVEVEAERLVLARPEATMPSVGPQLAQNELALAVPGETPLGAGWLCRVQFRPAVAAEPWAVGLAAEALAGPLHLRRRRPGDRFRPLGSPGSRTLQNFMVDRKLPRSLRAAWPILATPEAIVWVAGLAADARFVASSQSQSTIWVVLLPPAPAEE